MNYVCFPSKNLIASEKKLNKTGFDGRIPMNFNYRFEKSQNTLTKMQMCDLAVIIRRSNFVIFHYKIAKT